MLVQLVVLSLLACWSGAHAMYILEEAPQLFEDFIHKYEKTYATEAEKQHRFNVFVQNLEDVNRSNEQLQQEVYGINKFSDLSSEEFIEQMTCLDTTSELEADGCRTESFESFTSFGAPDSLDWRTKHVVTEVKNQEDCGSCYAFSSTGNIEGQYALKHKELLSLSEQQIVDCDTKDGGCSGGLMSTVFAYVKHVGGIESEDDYAYKGNDGECKFDANKVKVKLSDCITYNLTSQEQLKELLFKQGPISIAIDARRASSYKTGIIQNCKCIKLNHGVLLVGYGTDESGTPYWLVKNSWGTDWGEQGYFRMERGDGKPSCGVLNQYMASSVVL